MHRNLPLLIVAALCVTSCVDGPPEIGNRLPQNFAQARPVFDERVKARFPVGSEETRLVAELRRQHFKIQPPGVGPRYASSARYDASQIVCRVSWIISWSAEQGRVKEIAGDYAEVCL